MGEKTQARGMEGVGSQGVEGRTEAGGRHGYREKGAGWESKGW